MPKKINKRSDVRVKQLKKKPVKPKSKAKPKATPKVKITYQKLPKEGCCTDVLKTGQAYAIPFGFRDIMGTQRIDTGTDSNRLSTTKPTMRDASTEVITIRVPKQPKPAMVSPETGSVPELPSASQIIRSSIPRLVRQPKKNSRAELENRYEAMTGSRYSGVPLSYQEFRFMVEREQNLPSFIQKKI
jgi:hypothetical protein